MSAPEQIAYGGDEDKPQQGTASNSPVSSDMGSGSSSDGTSTGRSGSSSEEGSDSHSGSSYDDDSEYDDEEDEEEVDESDEEGSSSSGSSDQDSGEAPRKMPRLDETAAPPPRGAAGGLAGQPRFGGTSIFPAPPTPPMTPPLPRFGPNVSASPAPSWAVPPPPLPTLSAAAKDIAEMDVRAGLRLGVFRAVTRLNREQVMDEIESVRMTSHVERVLLESAQQASSQLPGVPLEEREYAWATVFFSGAEAADLCAALLCQPGRRSKWPRIRIQRLPLVSPLSDPYTAEEEQRVRVHQLQINAAAASGTTPITSSVTPSSLGFFAETTPLAAVGDTVLAQGALGWSVLSTGGLFPTLGLAVYLQRRRSGDFTGIDVCAKFDPAVGADRCEAGGQCSGVHLRAREQWQLLVPPVPLAKRVPTTPAESAWQQARRADTLCVGHLEAELEEADFVYMFRGCDGFVRAQTVRTVDRGRYGVVQFADTAVAQVALRQAATHAKMKVRFIGDPAETPGGLAGVPDGTPNGGGDSTPSAEAASSAPRADPAASCASNTPCAAGGSAAAAATHAPGVPFPPLPAGWEFGVSRRTMQFFFLQSGKKSTTWKHPVTQEQYKAQR